MKNEKEINKLKKAANDILERIEKLENEKPEFEVGKWYKLDTNDDEWVKLIVCCTEVFEDKISGYGISSIGDWSSENHWFNKNSKTRPATNEEVEAALIAEAKKRGFKEGVKVSRDWCKKKQQTIKENKIHYDTAVNALCFTGREVFRNGQWAEIIEEPKVIINGYEMKQDGDIISFGCASLLNCQVEKILEQIGEFNSYGQVNRTIKSITLDSGVEITVKQLKEICDNIK